MNSLSKLFGKTPRTPQVIAAPVTVSEEQSISARDAVLKRLARLRRTTLKSELSTPVIKRKQLGAGT